MIETEWSIELPEAKSWLQEPKNGLDWLYYTLIQS